MTDYARTMKGGAGLSDLVSQGNEIMNRMVERALARGEKVVHYVDDGETITKITQRRLTAKQAEKHRRRQQSGT